ncbi:MAG: FixH family protein [Myxococcales bacterium]|nr:FixH family protein [Myxococcales bacterium]
MVLPRTLWTASAALLGACTSADEPTDTSPSGDAGPLHAECSGAEDFEIGLHKPGMADSLHMRVLDAVPARPEKFENDWLIEVGDDDGPIEAAEITVEPYMPTHGHDGTFAPEVSPMDEAGQYAIDRINLWMAGPWEVRFMIRIGDTEVDRIVYDVCIEG